MTANNGWPGKPGVPMNPKQDGWHWLKRISNGWETLAKWDNDWNGNDDFWWNLPGYSDPERVAKSFYYLGPVLTPDEASALQKRCEEAERERDALRRDTSQQVTTDEMVRRLQHLGDWQAADRIEALQARADRNAAGYARVDDKARLAEFLHKQEIAAKDARIAELEAALRFYADPFKYTDIHGDDVRVPHFYSETDFGETARVALGLDKPWSLQP